MVDPASAFGIASGALQTVQIIGSTIQGLWTLYGKYTEADLTIHSLIVELTTIKSALYQLHEWTKCDVHGFLDYPDYRYSLDIAVEGCKAVMEVFSDEIDRLVRGIGRDGESLAGPLGFRARMAIIWNEELMRGHHTSLQSNVQALNLLLQVCQCRTASEQLELLRKERNRQIIKKVADDTATLRTSMSVAHSMADASITSIRSGQSSAIGGTVFDFDDAVVNSTAYRWVMDQHLRSRSVGNAPGQDGRLPRHPSQSTRRSDEGYGSGTAGTRTPNRQPSDLLQVPNAGLHINTSEDDLSRSNTTALARSSSAAYLNIRRSKSATSPLKSSGSKRDKLRSVFRVNSRSGSINSKPSFISGSPTDVRELRKYRKAEPNISIDLSSPSGVVAPGIVKAAQSGDIVEVEAQVKAGANIEASHDESARTALAVAAHCGAEDIVAMLLLNKADADTRDSLLMTPLHLAASRGHTGVVELLLGEDIDIDQRDSEGRTPFFIAVEAGHTETAKLLLECGCKVNTRATNQMTPLHAAAQQGHPDAVSFLLRSRVDIHAKDSLLKTALHYASESGHVDVVHKLLSAGAKIEAPGEAQSTPLISAATKGQLDAVDLLLRKGALVNAVDEFSMTALHWAATNGHIEVVELLIKKKASITATDQTGKQPMHCAAYAKQFAVVELLLRKKAPTNARYTNDVTPFHAACTVGSLDLVRLFFASGVEVNAPVGDIQRRAIHLAVIAGELKTIELLLDRRAKFDVTDDLGETPLTLACASGRIDVVQLLLQRGASPARQRDDGPSAVSPICVAAAKGHVDIVSLLLRNGADASERGYRGWNALLHAAHWGHDRVLKFLLDRCDLGAKQNLVALFFNNVGFAPNVVIDDEKRDLISNLVVNVTDELILRGTGWDGTSTANTPGSSAYGLYLQSYYPPIPPSMYSPTPPQELATTPAKSRTETLPNSGPTIVRPSRPIPISETVPPVPPFRDGIAARMPHHVRQTSVASYSSEHESIISSPVEPPRIVATPATPTPTPPVTDTEASTTVPIALPALPPSSSAGNDGFGTTEESDARAPTIRHSLAETVVGRDGNIDNSATAHSHAHDARIDSDINDGRSTPPRLPQVGQVADFNLNSVSSANTGSNSSLTRAVTAPNPLVSRDRHMGSRDGRVWSSVGSDSESDAESVASFNTAIEEVEVHELE